jgi:predicted small integral membrane protein
VDDEKNIQVGFKETGFEDVEWIGLAQDRDEWWALVNAVTNGVAVWQEISRKPEKILAC